MSLRRSRGPHGGKRAGRRRKGGEHLTLGQDRGLQLAVAAGAMLLAGVGAVRQADVVARGNLLPVFRAYDVDRVRFLGAEVYVDRSADAGDALTAGALLLVAGILFAAARRLAGQPRRAFVRAGWGGLFLAADDLLSAHETLGHNLPALAAMPLVDHPDDAVMAAYAAVVIGFCWRERELLRGVSRLPWWIAGAAAGLAVAHDVSPLHLRRLEEGLEVLAAAAALAGVVALARHHVGRATSSAVATATRSPR